MLDLFPHSQSWVVRVQWGVNSGDFPPPPVLCVFVFAYSSYMTSDLDAVFVVQYGLYPRSVLINFFVKRAAMYKNVAYTKFTPLIF